MRLKELRFKLNMTQQQLAEHLNLSYSAISKYETGATYLPQNIIDLIKEMYNVDIEREDQNYSHLKLQIEQLKKENKMLRQKIKLIKLSKRAIEHAQNTLNRVKEVFYE